MAWNEPGGSGNKDPWSGKSGGDQQGPPDLDEVVRKLQESLGGLFGGKKRPSGQEPDDQGGGPGGGRGGGFPSLPGGGLTGKTLAILGGILLVVWLLSGIYIIQPAERGVVLRFGAYAYMTEPGPHWRIPYPIEDVVKVNVDEISSFTHKAAMLTQDENIVELELTVQSRIQDAADYLFQDQSPEKTLRDATETEVRKTIGASKLDFILTEGRGAIAVIIKDRVQNLMNQYKTGLEVTSVNMQPAKPPEQVKDSFDDAIKAREDKERLENKAEAYANEIVPQARGEAARMDADAKAYRDQVIASAEGESARFLSVLREYAKAPEVTRERLYLETMEKVLGETNKVLLDVQEGANSLLYRPLDQLMAKQPAAEQGRAQAPTSSSPANDLGQAPKKDSRDTTRERRER
jgi:membrane protease subunit HflK